MGFKDKIKIETVPKPLEWRRGYKKMLSLEEFMSCFVYGGENNYFFRKPNW